MGASFLNLGSTVTSFAQKLNITEIKIVRKREKTAHTYDLPAFASKGSGLDAFSIFKYDNTPVEVFSTFSLRPFSWFYFELEIAVSRLLLNRFHHYANENASVKPLSLNCIASFFSTYYIFTKNCSVYRGYCVNYTSKQFEFSFCHNFLRNVKKIECCSLGCLYYLRPAVHWWYPRPRAQFFPIQTSRPVNDILY